MNFLLATISALLMTAAFDLHWGLAFIALLPLIILHNRKVKIPTWQHVAWGAYTGILFALLNMRWHWGVNLEHMDIENGWPFILFVWLISGLCGAWVALWSYMASKTQNAPFLAFWWGISEVIRAWFIGLLWYAPGAMLGTHWTVSFLGYSLAESPLIALASLPFGVITMSVFVALINLMIYDLVKRKAGIKTDTLFHLVLVVTVTGLFTYHFHQREFAEEPLSVSVSAVNNEKVDVIVLPENVQAQKELDAKLVIDSLNSELRFLYTAEQEVIRGNKFLLMPHGEYIPLATRPFLNLFGADKKIPEKTINPNNSLQYLNGVSILATACSDVLSYSLFSKVNPDVITNSASYSWFTKSGLLEKHAQQWARVRAVENNAWYYQSTNYGESFKISPKGELTYL